MSYSDQIRAAVLGGLIAVAGWSAAPSDADARGGGGVRASGATSVRSAGGASRGSMQGSRATTGARASTGSVSSGNRANTGNVNTGNRVNTGNINTGDVNINVDNDYGYRWNDNYHPVARGVAIGTAAAVSAAVVGSMIYSLPPSCVNRYYGGVTYYGCGSVWYQPQYQGDTVVYVVVQQPPG